VISCNSAISGKSFDYPTGATMPYRINADLPPSVRSHLPPHAQDIYREAFNRAFASHTGDVRQEEIAHRTAWAAVKRSYMKQENEWVPSRFE
jgi:cation transport regulator